MTPTQRAALAAMDRRNLGAVLTRRGWTWPEDVRHDEVAAIEVLRVLGRSRRQAVSPREAAPRGPQGE